MSMPIDSSTMPRRDPMIAAVIEQLQDADDALRHGRMTDAQMALVAAQSGIEVLLNGTLRKPKS